MTNHTSQKYQVERLTSNQQVGENCSESRSGEDTKARSGRTVRCVIAHQFPMRSWSSRQKPVGKTIIWTSTYFGVRSPAYHFWHLFFTLTRRFGLKSIAIVYPSTLIILGSKSCNSPKFLQSNRLGIGSK